jgi:fusion protein PurCD
MHSSLFIKSGKVRDLYTIGYNTLQMIATDRCSAFDRAICNIPYKGYFVNKMSEWWFQKTAVIVPNHYLDTMNSSMFVKACRPFKVEVVVRGYITGNTKTSLWTNYKAAQEAAGDSFDGYLYCGHYFPPGLVKHQRLPQNVVTPTTKGEEEDIPITGEQVVEMELVDSSEEWKYIHDKALELFAYGQFVADQIGLILVDTKYEFGRDAQGNILLIDELHTCDSSRYWLKDGYQAGVEPKKLDKDAVRDWVAKNTDDPYKADEIIVPEEVVQSVTQVYKTMYEKLLGHSVELPEIDLSISQWQLVTQYWENLTSGVIVVISGSISDEPQIKKLKDALINMGLYCHVYYASAHKEPEKVLEILQRYNSGKRNLYITCAGMSNALSGFVAANTQHPVIAHPLFKDQTDMLVNVHSTIQMPSRVPSMTVLSAGNVALAAARIQNH